MKAIVKSRAEEGLWLEDVTEPEIGINDVLIKIKKTGAVEDGKELGKSIANEVLQSGGQEILRNIRSEVKV